MKIQFPHDSCINQKGVFIMKKFTALFCTAAMSMMLTACGSSTKTVTVDTSALASALLETVTSDTLSSVATEILPDTYGFDDSAVESAVAYASSGATACEIVVIQSKDSKNTSAIEEKLQSRVDERAELYASYNAGEVEKLDNAIIESTGTYTVLCVCDDTDQANDILKEYGF